MCIIIVINPFRTFFFLNDSWMERHQVKLDEIDDLISCQLHGMDIKTSKIAAAAGRFVNHGTCSVGNVVLQAW